MPLNKLGAVSTMAREYPLGVFLGEFFGLGISRIHPNVEFVDTESMCNSNPPQFFCSFFSPKKMLVKPHTNILDSPTKELVEESCASASA